jgi:DNA-directed RNA polymerase specialized sigma24 family protein
MSTTAEKVRPWAFSSAATRAASCDGLSYHEIGARLFISPRTVENHLHKVFTKLHISSRNQLDLALLLSHPDAP